MLDSARSGSEIWTQVLALFEFDVKSCLSKLSVFRVWTPLCGIESE